MSIDWIAKLRHFLQVLAFALAIATIQYGFMPDRPYGPPVVYSLLIGTIIWAVIDLGREFIPSAAETGWPTRYQGLALVVVAIVAGYLLGTRMADALCQYFHFYEPGSRPPPGELRTSILITALAGIVGSYYFYNLNKGAYLERQMAEARQHANEARLKLLEAQLEPHMLFNTLANLRVLIATDAPRAQAMLDHMIAYLRATLSASRSTTHPLQAEFDRLHDYLALLSVRMGPRLAYTLDLPPSLAAVPVPPLLLQPLVENAIRHGLEPQIAGGRITVRASSAAGPDGPVLQLDVRDDGAGLPPVMAPSRPDGGFGIAQIRERLATLYGATARLDLAPAPGGGTCAHITMPLATAPTP